MLALTVPALVSAALTVPQPLIVCPADCVNMPFSWALLPPWFSTIVPDPETVPPTKFRIVAAFPLSTLSVIVPLSVTLFLIVSVWPE